MKIECQSCHFYRAQGDGKNGMGEIVKVGLCFRYPPTPLPPPTGSCYPVVGAIEWCGEYKPATNPPARKSASPKEKRK